MIEVRLNEEYSLPIKILYNFLPELITALGTLSTYEEVTPQDKKVIDDFVYEAQEVNSTIRNIPLDTDIVTWSAKPKLEKMLELIEILYSQIRVAAVEVCPELNEKYKPVYKIINELQLEKM